MDRRQRADNRGPQALLVGNVGALYGVLERLNRLFLHRRVFVDDVAALADAVGGGDAHGVRSARTNQLQHQLNAPGHPETAPKN